MRTLLVLSLIAPSAWAQFCYQPPLYTNACSVPPGAGSLFPHVAAFEGTFAEACNGHDRCYAQLGSSSFDCDHQFLSDMLQKCRDEFRRNWWEPPNPLLPICEITANDYFSAVRAFDTDPLMHSTKGWGWHQEKTRAELAPTFATLAAGSCGLSADRLVAVAPRMRAAINSTFTSVTGRAPTVDEFVELLGLAPRAPWHLSPDPEWFFAAVAYAAGRASAPIPSVGIRFDPGPSSIIATATASTTEGLTAQVNNVSLVAPSYSAQFGVHRTLRGLNFVGWVAAGTRPNRNLVMIEQYVNTTTQPPPPCRPCQREH